MGTVVVAVRAATAVLIKVVTAAFQDTRDTIMLSFIFCHIYIVTVGCSCKKNANSSNNSNN